MYRVCQKSLTFVVIIYYYTNQMALLGKTNTLEILKEVDFGLYLKDEEENEILLPLRYVPEEYNIGDMIDVFIYRDSEDRIIATTEMPYAQVGEFACLPVVEVSKFGAFLDWGLAKDLFVPFKEQKSKMYEGGEYVVYIYIDEKTDRIMASAKVDHFVKEEAKDLKEGDEVDLLVYQFSDLGYKAIVNNEYIGVLFENEVFRTLEIGTETTGYIKLIREDGKIDLILEKPGYTKIQDLSQDLLDYIKNNGGSIPFTDKSPAEEIYETFGISKKNFKKAIGDLYKNKIITLSKEGISLIDSSEK